MTGGMTGAAPIPGAVLGQAGAAAAAWMRRGADEEPAVLWSLAATALGIAEAFCGVALVARAHEDVLAAGPNWQALRGAPVGAIAGVVALAAAGAPVVLAPGAYAVDIEADGVGWVRVADAGGAARISVSYTAGLAAGWDALPPAIAQGVAMLAAHLFEERGGTAAPPAAVAALWRPWRRMRLAERRWA